MDCSVEIQMNAESNFLMCHGGWRCHKRGELEKQCADLKNETGQLKRFPWPL
jgi:hypothetical protein